MTRELTINLDRETQQRLRFIGETACLAEQELAEDAVKCYTRNKEQYILAVQQGQDDVHRGKVTNHKDLIEDLESRLADLG